MKRFLITGATGNVGIEVIRSLFELETSHQVIAGVRNVTEAQNSLKNYPKLLYVPFDFESPTTNLAALENIDRIFLLRPPHISDVKKYFLPLLELAKQKGVREVVFLSVQGAEKSKIIPHNKIERLVNKLELDYIFLRPSYFMQNLTTALLKDIQTQQKIILPSAKAQFNWIDTKDIGKAAALSLINFDELKNKAYEITGYENLDFYTVASYLSEVLEKNITYQPVSPWKFYHLKRKEGLDKGLVIVMLLLHFLPRFQASPKISDFFEKLTGHQPVTLKEFIRREKNKFSS